MWPYKIFISLLLLAISTSFAQGRKPPCYGACGLGFFCPEEEGVLWAINEKMCFVFYNECYFKEENCHLKDYCRKPLVNVTMEECQKLCPSTCPEIYIPVCAEYKGAKRKFCNECDRLVSSCKTGKAWTIKPLDSCQ